MCVKCGDIGRWGILVAVLVGLMMASRTFAGEEGEGMKVTFSLDADSYALGQPVFFVVALQNLGATPVRAHLPKDGWTDFELEVAFKDGPYAKLDRQTVGRIRTRPRIREFKPGEVVGASDAVLLRGFRPPLRKAQEEKADLAQWLALDRVGSYRMRATVRVDIGEEETNNVYFKSNEVSFRVTPAQKGFREFLLFGVAHVRPEFQIFEEGYEAAKDVLNRLEGTPYQKYVKLMMMLHYIPKRMDPEEPPPELSDEEKEEREVYKGLAEQIAADPHQRQTRMGEIALVYLLAYELNAQHPQKALQYGAILQDELPWSRNAGSAAIIREQIENEPLPDERVEPRAEATPPPSDAGP